MTTVYFLAVLLSPVTFKPFAQFNTWEGCETIRMQDFAHLPQVKCIAWKVRTS